MKQSYIVELIIAGQNTAVRVYQVIPLATKRFAFFTNRVQLYSNRKIHSSQSAHQHVETCVTLEHFRDIYK